MEEKEFIESVMSCRDAMWNLALRLGLAPDAAEDAVQDAVAGLWKARSRLRAGPELKAYCLAAVRSRCMDAHRAARETVPVEEAADKEAPPEPDTGDGAISGRVEQCLGHLPASQRTVFLMSACDGMDNREIAAATSLSETNVRQLLSRARRRLRAMLGKQC